jgi:hypothetical protein
MDYVIGSGEDEGLPLLLNDSFWENQPKILPLATDLTQASALNNEFWDGFEKQHSCASLVNE